MAARSTAGLGAAGAAAPVAVHVQDRAGEMMAAVGQTDHAALRVAWQKEHKASAGLWNKTMAAVTAAGTACGAVKQRGKKWDTVLPVHWF